MALLLREADVRSLIEMRDVINWVEESVRAYGEDHARNLPRQRIKLPKGTLHVLPAAQLELGVVGLKCYTSFRDGTRFLVLLYSAENGQLLALIEGDYLGMARTGAMSAVATKYMARPDADVLALFGTGWQAYGQALAIAMVRQLRQIRVFGRDSERRKKFANEIANNLSLDVIPCDSPEATLEGASIVATATTSKSPVVPNDAIQPGTHINAVGSNSLIRRELDEALVRRANIVVVDSRVQARQESGDLLIPAERGWLEWDSLPELSEIVTGHLSGRRDNADITIFESLGLGLQDIAVAAHIYARAREANMGDSVELFSTLPG